MADTHSVIPKKLWQALMDGSAQHFDSGGQVNNGLTSGANNNLPPGLNWTTGAQGTPAREGTSTTQPSGMTGGALNDWMSGNVPAEMNDIKYGINGIFPQSNFMATAPNITSQDFSGQISLGQNQQAQTFQQQQNLANALLQRSNGQGANPAMAQLNQTTGQNVANQAALMASARGASANPALIARQAAMQGANLQQQAVGQGATLQAQQQVQAQQALAQQQQAMAQEGLQQQSISQGALAAQNSALTTGSLGAQGINAQTAASNAAGIGGVVSGVAGALTSFLNKGGRVPSYAGGGSVMGIENYATPAAYTPGSQASNAGNGKGLGSALGKSGSGKNSDKPPSYESAPEASMPGGGGGQYLVPSAFADGGDVQGIESYATPTYTPPSMPSSGGGGGLASLLSLKNGGNVGGRATTNGDSPKNDTVPAMLSPGEIVLPRSVTSGSQQEMEKKAIEFLRHLKGGKGGYSKVAVAKKACGGKV